mmetsp:Transcript_17393/g.37840  ORF Transcript_17393/g.37840 Transcript_17393/m.37840 type:complete len:217 (-) Transcript_17393:699-1349(-)
MVVSSEPEKRKLASSVRHITASVCPVCCPTSSYVPADHTLITVSFPAVTMVFLWGSCRMHSTSLLACASNIVTRCGRALLFLRTSQIPTRPSNPPVSTNSSPLFSTAVRMHDTVFSCLRMLIVLEVSRFHRRTVPSSWPVTSTLWASQKRMLARSERCSSSVRRHTMSYASHMRTVLSRLALYTYFSGSLPLASLRLCAENCTQITGPEWPSDTAW